MKTLKNFLLTSVCLLLTPPVFAAAPTPLHVTQGRSKRAVTTVAVVDRYARRCLGQAPQRTVKIQGTALWGTRRSWDPEQETDERSSVLTTIDGNSLVKAPAGVKSVRLEEGHLVTSPEASGSVADLVLKATDSDGNPLELAICGAEPSADDPSVEWYRVEAWNAVAQEWENPCQATGTVPAPRAQLVSGAWAPSGARLNAPGKLTLACESGAISKGITWGYQPWAYRDGKSLADLHQACTRMARADYCGDGRSHTWDGTFIDMYDRFGMLQRTTQAAPSWDPALASFEAAGAPDGATCIARTRYGQTLESIVQECPGRFRTGAPVDFGEGDRCVVQRGGVSPETVLLRNRSYDGR